MQQEQRDVLAGRRAKTKSQGPEDFREEGSFPQHQFSHEVQQKGNGQQQRAGIEQDRASALREGTEEDLQTASADSFSLKTW